MTEIAAIDQVGFPILSTMVALPLVVAALLAVLPDRRLLRPVALAGALAELALSLVVLARFRPDGPQFQLTEQVPWIEGIGLSYHLAVDGVSVLFLPLTALLVVLVVLSSWTSVRHQPTGYLMLVFGFEAVAIGVFAAVDLILFFVFWELLLVPTYALIKGWGAGADRSRAASRYVLAMLAGSGALLVGFILLGVAHREATGRISFDLVELLDLDVAPATQTAVFFLLAVAFALKAPMFPLHSWMPAALLDGPAGMAILLAGLKMGVYGFLRFVMPLVPDAFAAWSPLLALLGVAAILFGALAAVVEPDLRRVVAFAAISHVGLAMLGLASLDIAGVQGALFLIVGLGVTSTAMLLVAGFVAHRLGTTDVAALGGLAQRAPALAAFALIAGLGAIALPGTIGFPGEFLVLLGAFRSTPWLAGLAVVTVILSASYVLVFYERAFHGPVRSPAVRAVRDLRPPEAVAAAVAGAAIIAFGFAPAVLLDTSEPAVAVLVDRFDRPADRPADRLAEGS